MMNSHAMQSVVACVNFMHSYSVRSVCPAAEDQLNDGVSNIHNIEEINLSGKFGVFTLSAEDRCAETTARISENHESAPCTSVLFCPIESKNSEGLCLSDVFASDLIASNFESCVEETCEVITQGVNVYSKEVHCDESSQKENYAGNADESLIKASVSSGKEGMQFDSHPESCNKEYSEEANKDHTTDTETIVCVMTSDSDSPEKESNPMELNVKYTCDICSKVFGKKSNLNRHYRIHTGDNPHACDDCHARFPTLSRLNEHKFVHSYKRPFVCTVCNKSFARMSNLTRHYNTHEGKRIFQCSACPALFCDAIRLRDHCLAHAGESGRLKFSCNLCHKKFLKKYNLDRHHYQVHTGKLPFKCKACGLCFGKKIDLLLHRLELAKEKERTFQKEVWGEHHHPLVMHDSTESEEERDCCVPDDDQETDSADETQDMLAISSSYACDEGGTKPSIKDDCAHNQHVDQMLSSEFNASLNNPGQCMDHHLQQHAVQVQCAVCNATFNDLSQLSDHLVTHVQQHANQMQCSECDATFSDFSQLEDHLVVHVQQHAEQMQCSLSNATFNNLGLHRDHSDVHLDEEQCLCNVCGMIFQNNSDLLGHLQTHTVQHSCELCEVQYNQPETLKDHYLSHHGIDRFRCYVCGKSFLSRVLLESHSLEHLHPSSDEIKVANPLVEREDEQNDSRGQLDNQLPTKNQPESRLAHLIQSLEARLGKPKIPFQSTPTAPPQNLLTETDSETPRLTKLIQALEARLKDKTKTVLQTETKRPQRHKPKKKKVPSRRPVQKFLKKAPSSNPDTINSVKSFSKFPIENESRSVHSLKRRKSSVYQKE